MGQSTERGSISDEEVAALLEKNGETAGAVRPYDFSAQRINRAQMPVLESISKAFAERAGMSLAGLLGRDACMHFDALESSKCAELHASLPVPGILAVVRLKPLVGHGYVSVAPPLLLTLLDAFFGGTGRGHADPQAAISPAAQRFLALMLRSFAQDFNTAWAAVAALELELVKHETNPRLVQLAGSLESVTVARFTVEFAAHSGRIDWLLPDSLLSSVREALSGDVGAPPAPRQEPWAPVITGALQDARLDTRAVLAQAQISLRELVSLAPGDIIPIEAPQQVTLLAGDVPLYHGRFGVSQGRNALKILSGASA